MTAAFPSVAPAEAEALCLEVLGDLLSAGAPAEDALIYRAAWRRLRAEVRSERARRSREKRWTEEQHPDATLDHESEREDWLRALLQVIEAVLPDEALRAIFPLWLSGERQTPRFAAALCLSGGGEEETLREIKRHKDRLMKFLRRHPVVREAAQRLRAE